MTETQTPAPREKGNNIAIEGKPLRMQKIEEILYQHDGVPKKLVQVLTRTATISIKQEPIEENDDKKIYTPNLRIHGWNMQSKLSS